MKWFCPSCGQKFAVPPEACPKDGWRPVEDLSGQTLADKFTLEKLIGVGGMGSTVWRANQHSIKRPVAVKLLPPATDVLAKRFAREAQISSNLNHPHIVTIHDYGQTDDDKLYLVMELLEGTSLHKELKQQTSLTVSRATHITAQILRALEDAHSKHVVHRDLKPGNLFLAPQNDDPDYIKVLDFGLAKSFSEDDDPDSDRMGKELDVTGARKVMCGTPNYMSPEQLLCSRLDARCDIYAMGVVLYRMLVGRVPFIGRTRYDLYRKVISTPAPSFSDVAPNHNIPSELESVVMRALEKDRDDRFPDARTFRSAIAKFTQHEDSTVAHIGTQPAQETNKKAQDYGYFKTRVTQLTGHATPWWRKPVIIPIAIIVLALLATELWVLKKYTSSEMQTVAQANGSNASSQESSESSTPNAAAETTDASAIATPMAEAIPAQPKKSKTDSSTRVGTTQALSDEKQLPVIFMLTTTPPGANVAIDDKIQGTTPINLKLAADFHTIDVTLSGHEGETIILDLGQATPGEKVVKQLKLTPLNAKRSKTPSRPTAKRSRKEKSSFKMHILGTQKSTHKVSIQRRKKGATTKNKKPKTGSPRIELLGE